MKWKRARQEHHPLCYELVSQGFSRVTKLVILLVRCVGARMYLFTPIYIINANYFLFGQGLRGFIFGCSSSKGLEKSKWVK